MNSSFTIKNVSSMKKKVLMFAFAAMAAQTMSAQTLTESKFTDNWYMGINGGANFKTTHTSMFRNLNPSAGLRIGRNITPVFGVAAEGEAYFDNKGSGYETGTFLKGFNVSVLGTTNFNNLFGGYTGQPRVFELVGVYGIGWGHAFHTSGNKLPRENVMTSKLGLDFTFNLGDSKAWQIYLEPNITYGMNMDGNKTHFNSNNSALGLLLGVNYKFGNSNGTHNFTIAELRDQAEIDVLNDRINDLRGAVNARDNEIAAGRRVINDLENRLRNSERPVIVEETTTTNVNVLQPSVIFRQGKSTIDAAQYASISMIATYMKNHPDSKILIKGYASPEGSMELNQRLSEARATAVKDALVKRYGVSADRLVTQGMGATDKMFDEVDFNRVVVFIDTTK